MKRYAIRDREAGNVITDASSLKEAIDIIDEFELMDDNEGTYVPNFYEVYDRVEGKIL